MGSSQSAVDPILSMRVPNRCFNLVPRVEHPPLLALHFRRVIKRVPQLCAHLDKHAHIPRMGDVDLVTFAVV